MKATSSLRPFLLWVLLALVPGTAPAQTIPRFRALVFSGTAGYRHESIEAGVSALRRLGSEHHFRVDATEDPAVLSADSLAAYDVLVFLNTSGDVLDEAQQAGVEAFIRGGGGFTGVHGAAATEYEWTWYGELVGAVFASHPAPQQATVADLDPVHPSTRGLPRAWDRFDEWYNFRVNPRGSVHVLAVLEESAYEGGEMGDDHPVAWAHEFDGGRAWYTALGHTVESYVEPEFLEHLLGGIEWAAGAEDGAADATVTKSFEKVVLMPDMTDPVEMGIDGRGRVYVGERSGPVKMWDPATGRTKMIGFVPVRMTIEDGLLGLTLDPDFDENGWMYVYYAPADGGPQRLSRWTVDDARLDPASEKILLEIRTQQNECCHSGGSLTFGPDGNLFLSTGDNSNPYPLGGSAMDERQGFKDGDAQRTSANTNDLRGKILRIRPLPDGTYAIPEGNLFEGDALHRPEIYTMGHRNPYRISVDPDTGWLYWGDVGIGNAPSEARGPWGWEEFNQARTPGFYGWPYFAGPNDAYRDFEYATETSGDYFDPEHPVNESPNNTGARELPAAQPAMIWYNYGTSEEHPELGSGGMSAMGGPVYRYDPNTASPHALPAYYDGSFLIYEWMRSWVKEVKFDENGHVLEINPFLPGMSFVRPGDMEIGPDGRLYVIEWGETFWGSNPDAQVVRVDYVGTVPAGPPSVPEARRPTASILWPPEGGIFDYDRVMSVDVRGATAVTAFSGHDTHEHELATTTDGTAVISSAHTHVPDIHYVDRYGVLEAGETPYRVVLQPRTVEAEHASEVHLAERTTIGKHPAEPDFADAALTFMALQSGATLHFEPLNLIGIDAIVLRLQPIPGGRLVVRRDGPDGPVIATVEVDATAGEPAEGTGALHADLLPGLPEGLRASYEGWRDIRIPVSDIGSTKSLFVELPESPSRGAVLRIDHLRFVGPGVYARGE